MRCILRPVSPTPNAGQFFTPEGFADSLVRESIQNSLDARHQSEKVQLRFHLSTDEEALSAVDATRYLDGLWPHVEALEGGREDLPENNSSMSFLVVEDFGTRGLGGPDSVEPNLELGPQRGEDFSYFWRNVGRSNKQDTERGRWGLGKTVFPAISRVNSFFGLTIRVEDKRTLLMGQSVLKIHHIGDRRYCPYGFFAEHQNDGFQLPITDASMLGAFRKDFCLKRVDESGLSVVVPFPDRDEIKASHMIRSAVLHYFYPILRGELSVEVSGDGLDVTIDAQSIEEVTNSVEWDTRYSVLRLRNLFRFARQTLQFGGGDMLVLPQPAPPRAPDWNNGRFDDTVTQNLKDQFNEKKMLAVRVPLTVRRKSADDCSTHFDVFIEQDEELDVPEDHYIRQGITISKISTLREKGFRGLVVVNDAALSTLLGDSENPSHTEWLEKEPKLKLRFDWGTFTVRFVRNALQRIVSQLLFIPEGRDDDLLRDLFFIKEENEHPQEQSKRKKKKKEDDGSDEPDISPPPSQPKAFELQKIQGGFRIIREMTTRPLPAQIDVEVAYEVRRGNPFRKYDKNDFQLEKQPIKIDTVGAPTYPEDNTLEIIPDAERFLVEVTGFDKHRDLAVKAIPKQQEDINASEV